MSKRTLSGALLLGSLLLATLTSCAYYNTFYLAQKYYNRGTAGDPYPIEKPLGQQVNEFRKSIEYSKKVLSQYPDSKWVDNAYLLWARALLGQSDPLKTVEMLEAFATRFPESELRSDAKTTLNPPAGMTKLRSNFHVISRAGVSVR